MVSPNYFRTLELPIVTGRAFTTQDTSDSVQVCLVSDAFVRKHLQGRSPIGMKVAFKVADSPQDTPNVGEIVGVAKQVKGRPDEPKDYVQIYVPMRQAPPMGMSVSVKHRPGAAAQAADLLRRTVAELEPGIAIADLRPLDDRVADALLSPRPTGCSSRAPTSARSCCAAARDRGTSAARPPMTQAYLIPMPPRSTARSNPTRSRMTPVISAANGMLRVSTAARAPNTRPRISGGTRS